MLKTFKLTALAALLAVSFTAAANSKSFEQIGNAPQTTEVTTYVINGQAKTALKALMPAGWQLYVHRQTQLPETVSWPAGLSWTAALASVAEAADFSAMVDWDKKAVYLRPLTVALEESAKRIETRQAAVTPLPKFSTAETAPNSVTVVAAATPDILRQTAPQVAVADKASVDALVDRLKALELEMSGVKAQSSKADEQARAEITTLKAELQKRAGEAAMARQQASTKELNDRMDVLGKRVDETTAREAAQRVATPVARDEPAAAPRAARELPAYSAVTSAVAFNRAGVEQVARKVAEMHGAVLDYRGVPDARFQGPVTLLGADLGEDVRLMAAALGPDSGVVFEVCRRPAHLRVTSSADGHTENMAGCSHPALELVTLLTPAQPMPSRTADVTKVSRDIPRPVAEPAPSASKATVAQIDLVATPVDAAPVAATPVVAAPVMAAPSMSLEIAAHSDLETSMRAFMTSIGYTLVWDSLNSFDADQTYRASGDSIAAVLEPLLPKLALEAEVNVREKSVRITDRSNLVKQ